MREVGTRRLVTTKNGDLIGRIVGIWDERGFYQGSYFEQVKRIPREHARNARRSGVNHLYLLERERVEGQAPQLPACRTCNRHLPWPNRVCDWCV